MTDLIINSDYTRGDKPLAIIVIGASGDLAKRKTYPALFRLFQSQTISPHGDGTDTIIYGFGRTSITSSMLRDKMRPFLQSIHGHTHQHQHAHDDQKDQIESFLNLCFYQRGSGYDDATSFEHMNQAILQRFRQRERIRSHSRIRHSCDYNCLFYLAIPPNLFYTVASTIATVFCPPQNKTQNSSKRIRILFEKPFGRDTESYLQLSNSLSSLKPSLDETQFYRIDHYLGKAMVRAIPSIRFCNAWARSIWSRDFVERVVIEMTESIGTDGRGGYFDQYGIIRDILQNHLLQVMCLIAMEEPIPLSGGSESKGGNDNHDHDHEQGQGQGQRWSVRDAKCQLLSCTRIPTLDDCILGQYDGYTDDVTVPDDSRTATFVALRMYVDNDRWRNVPFIFVAGKALKERKAEVRLVLRDPQRQRQSQSQQQHQHQQQQRQGKSEFQIRIQPEQRLSLTVNVKGIGGGSDQDGDSNDGKRMVLDLNPEAKGNNYGDDAYSRLIHDALRGDSSSFVRDDELKLSWKLFTPLLDQIEQSRMKPFPYSVGSNGPPQANQILNSGSSDRRDVLLQPISKL